MDDIWSTRSLRRLREAVMAMESQKKEETIDGMSMKSDRSMMISMSMVSMVLVDGKEESNKGITD